MTIEKRVIKKYPNRRLYDTTESKYITLDDVKKLVLEGVPFLVTDKQTGEDITRNILLQIIIEQEEAGAPVFSTDMLQQLTNEVLDSRVKEQTPYFHTQYFLSEQEALEWLIQP